ncbi:MAG: hypothetical protein UIH18_01175, partial [Fibrobacteraceae bacterium]|nr:hypothetical protein [Fibrobacteraceae bacterium]
FIQVGHVIGEGGIVQYDIGELEVLVQAENFGGGAQSVLAQLVGQFAEGDVENCYDDNCAMIFVKKSPDYGEGEFLFQKDSKDKGFSVRCVKN